MILDNVNGLLRKAVALVDEFLSISLNKVECNIQEL
jgi:hypothetical protein